MNPGHVPELEIRNLRPRWFKSSLAQFDVAVRIWPDGKEAVFVIHDLVLRSKKAGGYWIQFPLRPRCRHGVPVQDAHGRQILHRVVDVEREGRGGRPSEMGQRFYDRVLQAAIAGYESMIGSGGDCIRPWPVASESPLFQHQPGQLLHGTSDWMLGNFR